MSSPNNVQPLSFGKSFSQNEKNPQSGSSLQRALQASAEISTDLRAPGKFNGEYSTLVLKQPGTPPLQSVLAQIPHPFSVTHQFCAEKQLRQKVFFWEVNQQKLKQKKHVAKYCNMLPTYPLIPNHAAVDVGDSSINEWKRARRAIRSSCRAWFHKFRVQKFLIL